MKYYKLIITAVFAVFLLVSSCNKDLNTVPIDPNVTTSKTVFNDPAAYKEALAKVYAVLAASGQQGRAVNPDISGIDQDFSNYLRQY
jgi:starch-binding outer membrane protein, SusD/RagB family